MNLVRTANDANVLESCAKGIREILYGLEQVKDPNKTLHHHPDQSTRPEPIKGSHA